MSETTFNRNAWLLGHEAMPNFEKAELSEEVIEYYRQNKDQNVSAIKRGYVLPGSIPLPAAPVETVGYPIEATDCIVWLGHTEKFVRDFFGETLTLANRFILPQRLPWKRVLPIYIPIGMSHRDMVEKAFKSRKLRLPYESLDIMKYTGAQGTSETRLYLIERSPTPTDATMGLPPKFAKHWFAGRQTLPLNLCGYGIATSLWHSVEKQFLDPQTWTWFPENIASGGRVACGLCGPDDGGVGFCDDAPVSGNGRFGFREAIVVPSRP